MCRIRHGYVRNNVYGRYSCFVKASLEASSSMSQNTIVPADGAPSAPSYNFNLLMDAISGCAADNVRQLVRDDPQLVNTYGWHRQTALHRACLTGVLSIVKILLEAQANVNARNNFNETPLHYACKRGSPPLVYSLLEHGADPFLVDNLGKGTLHHAAEAGSVPVMHMLCTHFPELNLTCKDNNLHTPLHIAIKSAQLEAFHYLMRKGRSNLKAADSEGNWPIHISAQEGYGHMTWSQLCVLGLPAMHIANKHGYTPYQLANMYDTPRHMELIKELKWLKRLPEKSSIKQPAYVLWYFYLLVPILSYSMAILVTRLMAGYHGLIFLPVVAGNIWVMRSSSHRLSHVSRWSNPIFAGAFAAGLLHTMLVYMVVIRPHMMEHTMFVWSSYLLAVTILVLLVKLVTLDPGTATQSAQDKVTGKTVTILDVGRDEKRWEEFCVECEIVKAKFTKHCKLCKRCMAGMDHHCLFLLKCVARDNHSLFVWFILCCVTCMLMFLCSAYIYRQSAYAALSLTETLLEMLAVDSWVLSLILLNVASVFWAWCLLIYQCRLIKNGYTAYFQPKFKGDVLTDFEKFMNVVNFLTNRKPHVVNPCIDI